MVCFDGDEYAGGVLFDRLLMFEGGEGGETLGGLGGSAARPGYFGGETLGVL